jgi:hypothetical protein
MAFLNRDGIVNLLFDCADVHCAIGVLSDAKRTVQLTGVNGNRTLLKVKGTLGASA